MATPTTLPATFVAGDVLTAAQMNNLRGAFRVLQVVSTTKTDIFSSSIATGANSDITGLSVSITPSATSSKVLLIATVNGCSFISPSYYGIFGLILKRGGTAIGGGTTAGNRTSTNALTYINAGDAQNAINMGFHFLDSPSSTSAQTYQLALQNPFSVTATLYCNQAGSDANFSYTNRTSSTITALEISA